MQWEDKMPDTAVLARAGVTSIHTTLDGELKHRKHYSGGRKERYTILLKVSK